MRQIFNCRGRTYLFISDRLTFNIDPERVLALGVLHFPGSGISSIIQSRDSLREQNLRIKKQFADTIVFFRLGDFNESLDEDAKKDAGACNIVLPARHERGAARVAGGRSILRGRDLAGALDHRGA